MRCAWLLAPSLALATGCATIRPEPASGPPGGDPVFSHALLDRVLGRFVDEAGRVDYAALAADREALDRYAAALAAVSPDSHPGRFPDAKHRLAYWINAYNASVLRAVLQHRPLGSVLEVRPPWLVRWPRGAGFFLLRTHLGGRGVSLYGLENRVIRERFDDPRIHFALNCASGGCPRLPRRAFHGESLDAELERETRRFLAEARNLRIDPDAREIALSAIFEWYERDFQHTAPASTEAPGEHAALRGFLARHLPDERRAELEACGHCRIRFLEYDWSLNDRSLQR